MRFLIRALAALFMTASFALAQSTTPPSTPSAPAASAPPSVGIRNKISAGDLLSAESILEVHRAKNGEDGPWLTGLSWLARGALLVGDTEKAERYAAQVRAICADRLAHGSELEKDHDLEIAYGAAIEVEAQRLERTKSVPQAAEYIRSELARVKGPVPVIARLNKRLNMLTLTGETAPELVIEDFVGTPPPTLASLRGKPLLLFIWYEGCGDCKAQEATLARVKSRYEKRGLQVVALTRYYEEGSSHTHEKAEIDSVWKAVYADVGTVPIVISTASMERYGGSSTPTFVFLDREGIVRGYTPTRLTEAEFDRILESLMH
jgi:thiol-disulfide isomerase/thioredoxin